MCATIAHKKSPFGGFLLQSVINMWYCWSKLGLEFSMNKIELLNKKIKELQKHQHNHEQPKVYKTKLGKWFDTSLKAYFSNWFKKTKDPWRIEFCTVFIGMFCCIVTTCTLMLMFSVWLALAFQAVMAAVVWKVCSVFTHVLHTWNSSLTWGDKTRYNSLNGKVVCETIVSKDVFEAALNELEHQEPAAQDLVQQLRNTPLSPHDSQIIMDHLNHFWEINELLLFRKGVIEPNTVSVENIEHPNVMKSIRTLRL